jgi:hypothetical protein
MKRIILASIVCLMFASICFSAPGIRQWKLTWDPNTEEDLAGYRLYYGKEAGIYGEPIDVGNVSQYLITGNIPANSYLALTAYDLSGNESGYSEELFFSKDQAAPAVPGGLKIEEIK